MTISKAQIKASTKYERNTYDKILIRVKKDGDITREIIASEAAAAGESMQAYIIKAIQMRINGGYESAAVPEVERETFIDPA